MRPLKPRGQVPEGRVPSSSRALTIGLCAQERGQLAACLEALGIGLAAGSGEAAMRQALAAGDIQFVFLGLDRAVAETLRLVQEIHAAATGAVPLLGVMKSNIPPPALTYVTAALDGWIDWPMDLARLQDILVSARAAACNPASDSGDDDRPAVHDGRVVTLSEHPGFGMDMSRDIVHQRADAAPDAPARLMGYRVLAIAHALAGRLTEAAIRVEVDAFHETLDAMLNVATLLNAERLGDLCHGWSGVSAAEIRQFGRRHADRIAQELAAIERQLPLDDEALPYPA